MANKQPVLVSRLGRYRMESPEVYAQLVQCHIVHESGCPTAELQNPTGSIGLAVDSAVPVQLIAQACFEECKGNRFPSIQDGGVA
jgi:hypothetical protein